MPTILIKNNGIFVKDLIIVDPDTVNYYKILDSDDVRLDSFSKAVVYGTQMLKRADTVIQADYMDKRVSEIMNYAESQAQAITDSTAETIRKSFDPDEADSAIKAVKKVIDDTLDPMRRAAGYIQEKQENLDKAFNPSNSDGYSGKMLETFNELQMKFHGMFDPESKSSFPSWIENNLGNNLSKSLAEKIEEMHNSMRKELMGMKEELAKTQAAKEAVDEIESRTPIKGGTFEGEVQARLESLAQPFGDVVTNTTNDIGVVSASKKGDFNYDVNGLESERIVIECKNTQMAALPAMFKAMDKSMSNRSASFAILITNTEDQLQKQIGAWQFFKEKNLIVTHSEMLEVAIKVAKLFLSMSNSAIEGVDFVVVEKSLLMIEDIARKSRTVKTKLSNIEESVSFLRNLDDERKASLELAVSNIRDEFAKASEMAA